MVYSDCKIYVWQCSFESQNRKQLSQPNYVSVGVLQGLLPSSFLFIIVMEALSREFRSGCPWELLYANDLVFIAESLGELKVRLKNWKDGLEEKGLKVNVGKTRTSLVLVHNVLKVKIASVKFPCGIFMKGFGVNSIL